MAEQILSRNEIDALLAAVNDGEVSFEDEDEGVEISEAAAVAVKYDLLSQDRIIRGRMPTLDIINDRFARQFRITLSNSLRKIIQVNVESTSLMKYGEFLNYLPIPSCLNVVRFSPLRGSCILAIESKLIYAFLNNWFGGATNPQERIENRDFTAIELMIIRKVVDILLDDIQKAWAPVYPIVGQYLRTEINPQFLALVAPSDVVVLTSFELEVDGLRGTVQLVIPYGTIEPIRQHLSSSIGGDADPDDTSWQDLICGHLTDVETKSKVVLGTSMITIRELIGLNKGDVVTLAQNRTDPLRMYVEHAHKFSVLPMEQAGYLAAKVVREIARKTPPQRALEEVFDDEED
jgi:flagellar motor switch protein FliM